MSETWTLANKRQGRIVASDMMTILRRLEGCALRDAFNNDVTRNELGVESILAGIRTYREHVTKMSHDRLPRQAML